MAVRSVACVGGAASIDRADRVEGKSWFPQERIGDLDIEAVTAGGHADILITHEAPSGWKIPGIESDGPLEEAWRLELPTCEQHRERVREVLDFVTPSVLIHGHYHSAYEHRSAESWGRLETFGLNCNESKGWGIAVREVVGELWITWADDER